MRDIVIAGYARSPFHLAGKGALARVRPDDLAAQVIRGLIDRTHVDPKDIEDIIVGCAFPEGEQGFNIARLIGLTPHAYVMQRRLDTARSLIRHGSTLAGAAVEAGFADQSHMHRVFVARHGFTPGAYAGAFCSSRAISSKSALIRSR